MTNRTVLSSRLPRWALAVALAAGLLAAPTLVPPPAAAADTPLAEAGKKLRDGEAGAAVRLLEGLRAKDPKNPDVHLLYQEAAVEALGVEAVVSDYRRKASENADDPLFQFLYLRLLAPAKTLPKWKTLTLKHKTSPWPFAGLARAQERVGKFKDALASHDQAVSLAPTGDLRFRAFQAYGLERASDYTGAASAWQQVLTKSPKNRTALLGRGEALRHTGDYQGSLAAFDAILATSRTDVEARYRRGLTLVDAEKFDEATAEIDALLTTERGMLLGLCLGAEAALRKALKNADKDGRMPKVEELEPALKYAERAVAVDEDSPYAQFVYGAVLEVTGEDDADRLDEAQEAYDAAIDMLPPGPEKVRALIAKAFVLLRLAQWEDAVATARKALELDEKNVTAHLHSAHALVALEQYDTAIKEHYKKALKIDANDARIQHGWGTAVWDNDKSTAAKKMLEKAVKLDPDNGVYRVSLGELYFELGKFKAAVSELFEATELRPKDPVSWSAYGRACTAQKHYPEAIEAYEKVLELLDEADEYRIDIYLYLAILHDRNKDREKARIAAEKFVELGGTDDNMQNFIEGLLNGD